MGLLVSGSGPWGPQGPAVTWGTDMIMGSGPRLRTCVELVDHGVDADGHAPATTDEPRRATPETGQAGSRAARESM